MRVSSTMILPGTVGQPLECAGRAEIIVGFPRIMWAGRRKALTLPNGVTMGYSYDTASQLTGINYTLGAAALGNLAYSYDLAGRRTIVGGSYARTGMPAAVTNAGYNADNQQTTFGTSSLNYDANGNMTSDGANTYTWNARNQLSAISGQVSASFAYDAFGRRISKTIGAAGTSYLYDGVNPVEELSGGGVSASMLTGLAVDEYFQRNDSSGTFDYLTDVLGSTVALAGASGALGTQYTYEPFGNTAKSGPQSANPFQFIGRENDATGLYFYRARYYSPTLQRFVSEDPLQILGGDSNFYAYVSNGSTNFTDPSGLWGPLAHDQMIWNALHPCGVSDADIYQIQQGSREVDIMAFQDAQHSYMHAMSNGNSHQTSDQAHHEMSQFVAQEMQDATEVYNAKGESQAMYLFGVATHPLMDWTSPAHTNANGKAIPWCGISPRDLSPFGCSKWQEHGDHGPRTIEDLNHLNADPGVQKTENIIIRYYYQRLTGKMLPKCSCKGD